MRTGLYQCKRCLDVFGLDNRIAADRIRPAIICDPRRAERLRFAGRRARLDQLSTKTVHPVTSVRHFVRNFVICFGHWPAMIDHQKLCHYRLLSPACVKVFATTAN